MPRLDHADRTGAHRSSLMLECPISEYFLNGPKHTADDAPLEPNGCSLLMLECPNSEYFLNGSKKLADEIRERPYKRFDCVGQDFKCCLQVSQHETILQVSKRLGKLKKCPASELVLICKGKVVSCHPMFSLEALDLFESSAICKLLVLQRPPGPAWLRITVVFLCSSLLPPIVYNHMHSDSPISRVKSQLREALRCSVAEFSLHLADGAALPDAVTLSELGLADDERIYCRIRSEAPEPVPPSGLAAAAAAVREQVRRADAVHCGGVGCKRRPLREPLGTDRAEPGDGESTSGRPALASSRDSLSARRVRSSGPSSSPSAS